MVTLVLLHPEKRSPPNASSPKAARPLSPGCIIWSPAIWKPVKIRQYARPIWNGYMAWLNEAPPECGTSVCTTAITVSLIQKKRVLSRQT